MVLPKVFACPLILAVTNILAHNNLWLCYYIQVKTFGGSIYFAVDETQISKVNYSHLVI